MMTNDPPTDPTASRPRGNRAATLSSWLVILLVATAIITRPLWMTHWTSSEEERKAALSVERTPSAQLQMISRIAVGAKALSGAKSVDQKMIANIEDAITSPIDELRAIIVIDELAGDQAALKRLDAFEKKYTVVRLRKDVDALRELYTNGLEHLTPAQEEVLLTRHRWFGKLALSHGLPAQDPTRQAAMRPATMAMLLLSAAGFIGFLLFVAGLVLGILAIVFFAKGKLHSVYQPPGAGMSGLLIEAFALYLAAMLGVSFLLGKLFIDPPLWVNALLLLLLPLVLFYLRIRGASWPQIRYTLGLHHGRGVWREIGWGIVGYIAGLPLLVIGGIISFFLMKYTGTKASHPIVNQPMDGALDVMQLFMLACGIAPLLEEVMFRGALFGHLRAKVGWWLAAPLVSLIFAAIHPQGWAAIPVLGAIALTLAALREWRGSLIASMTAHACNNSIAVIALVLTTM